MHKNSKTTGKKIYGLIFCLGIIFLGTVWCGRGVPIPYNQTFSLSSGQCQGGNISPAANEQTLTVVASAGPNITICILDASNGALLRHYDLDVHGDVVGYGHDLLYVNERGEAQGDSLALCAIHSNDGIKRWCQTQLHSVASVTVDNGMVYAAFTDHIEHNSSLVAVSERDGRILWRFHTQVDPLSFSSSLVAPGQGIVYIDNYQNLSTGSPTPSSATATPAPGVRGVCAVQSSSGRQLWCESVAERSITAIAADASTLYVRAIDDPSQSGLVYAFNALDGSMRWHTSFSLPQSTSGTSQLLVAGGIVFTNAHGDETLAYPDRTDQLFALRADDGKQLWSVTRHGLVGSLTVADTLLYLISSSGVLDTFHILDGTPAWSQGSSSATPSPVSSSLVSSVMIKHNVAYILVGANIYVNNDTYILAVRADNGATLWQDRACANAAPTPTASTSAGSRTDRQLCYWTLHPAQQRVNNVRLYLLDA